MKVKFCGITNLNDAIKADRLGADMLGFILEPGQVRYVTPQLLYEAKRILRIPIVAVKLEPRFDELIDLADYIQVHKVLKKEELEKLRSYSSRFILYVPASKDGLFYMKLLDNVSNAIPLIDSLKKGAPVDLVYAKELLKLRPDSGLGGGITPDNIHLYVALNPAWIDVSSGIESHIGKKDEAKMKKIIEVVKSDHN